MNNYYCVIMAGGAGSRLWPISRQDFPKQFIEFSDSGKSFLQITWERFCKIVPAENILVVTGSKYTGIVQTQLPDLAPENLLPEPYSRNTAPCIAYATYVILKRDPDATVVVTPCDHVIFNDIAFRSDVLSALDFASANDALVTLGVSPTRPDPNFGYIQVVGGKAALSKGEPVKVKTFTEKPDPEMAELFVKSREFVWNAGIFSWKARAIKEEIDRRMPELAAWFQGWESAVGGPSESEFILKAYSGCERKSIDFGLMEKTDRAWVYPASFEWCDIGSWTGMYDFIPKDGSGNAINYASCIIEDTADTLAVTTKPEKLAVISGLDGYLVVDTKDILFICPRDEKKITKLNVLALRESEKFR